MLITYRAIKRAIKRIPLKRAIPYCRYGSFVDLPVFGLIRGNNLGEVEHG
jgi:hypothetical protein